MTKAREWIILILNHDLEGLIRLSECGLNLMRDRNDQQMTALHLAAREGDLPIVQLLLRCSGAAEALNAFDDVAYTPLTWAAAGGYESVVRTLIEAGANIDAQCGSINNTPLREIAETGSLEMIALLLSLGADPGAPGWMQLSASDKLRERASKDVSPKLAAIIQDISR